MRNILLLSLALFVNVGSATEKVKIDQNAYLIVHSTGRFKFELSSLKPDKNRLVLLTSGQGRKTLREKDKNVFVKIIETEDFSENSIVEIYLATKEILGVNDSKKFPIITHDEYSMASVAKARDIVGSGGPSYQTIGKFTDKILMKQALRKADVRLPLYQKFNPNLYTADPSGYLSQIEKMKYPLFTKKTGGTCSEGIAKIDNKKDLESWCESHKNDHDYEIDEYISGDLFHCETIVKEGRILDFYCCGTPYPDAQFILDGKPLGSMILPTENSDYKALYDFNYKVFDALTPPDGVTHLEVFKKENGELVFVEIAARSPGSLVPFLYEAHSGVNLQQLHYQIQMKLPISVTRKKDGSYYAFIWFASRNGTISKFNDPDIKSEYSLTWKAKVGDKISGSEEVRDRLGEIVLWNKNFDQLSRDFYYLSNDYRPYEF